MKQVRITPNPHLNPRQAHKVLEGIGVSLIRDEANGTIRAALSQAQLDLFYLRGASHHVEVLPEK